MSRLFWLALGATAGVLVVRRATRAAQRLTPQGAADNLAGAIQTLGRTLGEFSAEVRIAMDERDAELRRALGMESEEQS